MRYRTLIAALLLTACGPAVAGDTWVERSNQHDTFRSPGQATSYFYGYSRILELRAETELALGEHFDRLAFNNFLLDQGLLPLDLLADAVRTGFVPAQLAKSRPAPVADAARPR